MRYIYNFQAILWRILFLPLLLISNYSFATHAQSADITYQCLGNNQYQINLSFYRDCAGVNAPNTVNIDVSSASCNQNLTLTLNQLPNTGVDVTPICNSMNTTCNGGAYPGVEEYLYSGIITIPQACTDWVFSFTLCCRNNAINTIQNPGGENIYIEAQLNNFLYACNNSPTFSNAPVSFPCVGQTSCFNHGAYDADGDSLYYSLLAPATGPNTTVTYNPGYTAQQPLISNPATTFNTSNGDICMTPQLQEVTVLAVRVEEYRDGNFIGSVIRDIQLRTVVCNNTLPTLSGINGTGVFSTTACAGNTLTFTVPSFDPDQGQTVNIISNNAIPNANFVSNGAPLPTGTFTWTPTVNDISPNPHCFTVTVSDDNCPFNGVQVYSFCITVSGFGLNTTANTANCGASNGSATVTPIGGVGPFTYQWAPSGGNNANANGLQAGQYTVTVTDNTGCISTATVTIGSGAAPGNLSLTATNVDCFGASSGSITANANGGQQPYTYQWSNGGTTPTISNLPAGTYWVVVTTNQGCQKSDTITITEPATPVMVTSTTIDATCFGANDGGATATPSGGTAPYTITWNTNPIQNGPTAMNLTSGSYVVTVTDDNGCTTSQTVVISEPFPININLSNQQDVNCFGGSNGALNVNVSGGQAPYNYNWNNNAYPNVPSIINLPAGVYLLSVTDANGCVANAQYTITEPNELNLSTVNVTHVTCNGLNNGSIQTNTIGGTPPYSYQWSPPLTTQPNINNLAGGYYVGIVTDSKGCIDTTGVTINEPSPIATMATGDDTICPGQLATIGVSAYGGVGNYTFQWSNTNTGTTQQVSPAATTIYTVTATDGNGCVGTTDSVVVLVNDINLVTLSVVPDTMLCQGAAYTLGANVTGGIGNYNYTWNNGVGQGAGPHLVSPIITTNYTVTILDVCGNTRDETVVVNVEALPNVDVLPQSAVNCGQVNLTFQNNQVNPGGYGYSWNFGDNTFSNDEEPTKAYTQTGVYPVILTVTSLYGCENSDQAFVNITINTKPKADFEADPYETTMLNPEINFDNFSADANFYAWSFGDGETANVMNPTHTYKADGRYAVTLIASHANGCKDTVSKEVLIEPEYNFYIPNAFTPDNDGLNDVFTAKGEEIDEFSMQIFNRWGEMIFETNDLDQGWDGTAKGGSEVSMVGVYVYKIKLRDWQGLYHNFTGHVSLLK